ncbi:MAG: autotransporter-associated beta strand repeat-containing protein [Opitutaceae bacterium]
MTLGSTVRINSDAGSLTFTRANSITGTNRNLTLGGAAGGTVGGTITTGTGTLTKDGAGTWNLNGANTYSGATLISAGTLALGSTGSLASTTYSIGNGATFDVSAQSNYSLAAVAVTIDVGSAGAGLFNGPTGALTLGNALTLNFTTSMLTNGQTYNLFDFGSQTEDFSSVTLSGSIIGSFLLTSADTWTGSFGGYDFTFSEATGILSLAAIPEPSTWALLFGGASLLFVVCRKWQARSRSLAK